jgi:glycerophosphoryl diester phosphodiesterase
MHVKDSAVWLITRPIAHRGLHDAVGGVPENSLAAFDSAAVQGYPVELDVQLSKDGQIVVLHDPNLARMTGVDAAVKDTDYEVISKLRLAESDQHIPTLTEVLEIVNGRVPVMIEIKSTGSVGILEQSVLAALSDYQHETAIVSFNPMSLRYFRKNGPELPRGQISGLFLKADLGDVNLNLATRFALQYLLLNGFSRPHFISYQLDGASTFPVMLRRKAGMSIVTWPVKSAEEQDRAERYADNIIFENFTPRSQAGD